MFDMIMQVFLSSNGLIVFFYCFAFFCIIADDLCDTMQCCAAALAYSLSNDPFVN